MGSLALEILRVIEDNNGAYSWYQIDRELSMRLAQGWEQPHAGRLMVCIRQLEHDGLIAAATGHCPSQPLYALTLAGRKLMMDAEATGPSGNRATADLGPAERRSAIS